MTVSMVGVSSFLALMMTPSASNSQISDWLYQSDIDLNQSVRYEVQSDIRQVKNIRRFSRFSKVFRESLYLFNYHSADLADICQISVRYR
ncbi:hypothetical protein K402DRAFT_223284 [Aulographum hederae CBS 113979]|uniref:Uncharacterized protein n=1 Tax=Aulographum hederae CBS 113979 TaxID=1176131 RepID=A0A6G1GL70_9PEZI|nr:hypothetical protein K402DRAFT_223284 [Aulographum hederae CBS 113979]